MDSGEIIYYGEKDKNTIEFRISNSTLNPQVVKDNIRLFGSLMKVSKEMSLNPGYKNEEFKIMKNRSLTEREKVEALLELLFEDEKIKGIYRERWESVRNKEIFDELTLGQKQTFERGNYQIKKENCRRVAEQIKVIEEMIRVANEIRKELEQSKELNYYN